MTTPQNELYNLSYKIHILTDLFQSEEGEDNIFDQIKRIDAEVQMISKSYDSLQDQMALIIKLLNK